MVGRQVAAGDLEQADRAADVKGIVIVFTAAVLAAVYFVAGWVPGI